jgi:hypothetical protein
MRVYFSFPSFLPISLGRQIGWAWHCTEFQISGGYLHSLFSRREFLWSAVETVLSITPQSANRGKHSLSIPVETSKCSR